VPPKKQPKPFAYGTTVSVEQSRAELEGLLEKHGATEFMMHRDSDQTTTIMYRMQNRMVKQVVRYPKSKDLNLGRRTARMDEKSLTMKEWRRRWRAQVLITKGKLELIESGEASFDEVFLSSIMLADGRTVAEVAIPRIAEGYDTGKMPNLLLPSGDRT